MPTWDDIPSDKASIEAAIGRAPGVDRPLTDAQASQWATGVVIEGGGYAAVRKAVAAKRGAGQRGPQVAPTKQLVSVRYSPEVLAFFKAGGAGWQTRMDEALKTWVARHRRRTPQGKAAPAVTNRSGGNRGSED